MEYQPVDGIIGPLSTIHAGLVFNAPRLEQMLSAATFRASISFTSNTTSESTDAITSFKHGPGDMPPGMVAGGTPPRIINAVFDAETIALLVQVKWSEWSGKKNRDHFGVLSPHSNTDRLRKLVTGS